jgi:hypothetical protein
MMAHQAASRAGAEQKFKGGLSGTTEMTTKLHTAHHLLLAALQKIVSPDIHQKGSNITDERLRIDFNLERKLTEEEKHAIEAWVNDIIAHDYSVVRREMPKADAESIGAEMEFGTTYPDIVSVYFIEDKDGNAISKNFVEARMLNILACLHFPYSQRRSIICRHPPNQSRACISKQEFYSLERFRLYTFSRILYACRHRMLEIFRLLFLISAQAVLAVRTR